MGFSVRKLQVVDAADVQKCYDSQPRLMLVEKRPTDPPYASVFREHMISGCQSFGAFDEHGLAAFCTVWKWPELPICTLVLFVARKGPATFNPEASGLAAAVDAALDAMEALGAPTAYFVRAESTKWRNSRVTTKFGKFGASYATPVERIPAGALSKHAAINQLVLSGKPVPRDAVLVSVMRRPESDF